MKTYKVMSYDDKTFYTVTLDEEGVVEIDGLLPDTAEHMKFAVRRHMERRGLPAITALGLTVGSYSHLIEVKDDSVTDSS